MDFAVARHNMVESQVRPNRVTDPYILEAIADLPREAFTPQPLAGVAYVDEAIPIGAGRYMMEAMILARLLQAAEIQEDDVALLVGCGSGYEAAVLSYLASTVVALESDTDLAERASDIMANLGIDTVAVVEGELGQGFARQAPYDVIVFNGAVAEIPATISGQLAEGGRLVAIVGVGPMGKATLETKNNGVYSSRVVFDAGTPLLAGFDRPPSFSF